MGDTSHESGRDESPVHTVMVEGFCLDHTEMAAPNSSAALVVRDWAHAEQICSDRGGRLPTEAEFEKAARGGCELGDDPSICDTADARPYPWGTARPSCERANHSAIGPQGPKRCQAGPSTVMGQGPGAGPYGHINLSGNLWEPCTDWYHPEIYRNDRPANPGGPKTGNAHVIRGGAWDTFSTNMRISNRFSDHLTGSSMGVRCVFNGATPTHEDIEAQAWSPVDVTVTMHDGQDISGRWLTVTAFDEADMGQHGMPIPGRSPVAEAGAKPANKAMQTITLALPKDGRFHIAAALDNGRTGGPAHGPAASSGGVGISKSPITAKENTIITVSLSPLPAHPHIPRP